MPSVLLKTTAQTNKHKILSNYMYLMMVLSLVQSSNRICSFTSLTTTQLISLPVYLSLYLVSHFISQFDCHFVGHSRGHAHCGHASRLRAAQGPALRVALFVQILHHLRRLAAASLANNDKHLIIT
jgi:hypothetical protein